MKNMKKILNIIRITPNKVEIEYFDGAINSVNYTTRKVYFPTIESDLTGSDAYIFWFGKKKIVESFNPLNLNPGL